MRATDWRVFVTRMCMWGYGNFQTFTSEVKEGGEKQAVEGAVKSGITPGSSRM
jgi:hypothetical protein